jgi:hypothetical protein
MKQGKEQTMKQGRVPGAKIDFKAIAEVADRLGYSRSIATRIEKTFGWAEIRTYGDIIDAYVEDVRRQAKYERREGRRLHYRREPVGCERTPFMNFGRLCIQVMNTHLKEIGIALR